MNKSEIKLIENLISERGFILVEDKSVNNSSYHIAIPNTDIKEDIPHIGYAWGAFSRLIKKEQKMLSEHHYVELQKRAHYEERNSGFNG